MTKLRMLWWTSEGRLECWWIDDADRLPSTANPGPETRSNGAIVSNDRAPYVTRFKNEQAML